MNGSPKVIEVLQRAVSGEALAEHQYLCDAEALALIGLSDLAAKMHAEANEEKAHLARFARRLIFLEAAPLVKPLPSTEQNSVTAMLRNQLRLEMEAVALYREGVTVSLAEGDPVSRGIFEETLADEEDHVRFLEGQLALVAKLGEVNYIQAYVKLPEEG